MFAVCPAILAEHDTGPKKTRNENLTMVAEWRSVDSVYWSHQTLEIPRLLLTKGQRHKFPVEEMWTEIESYPWVI
jgi:hypothetical protein